MGLIEIIVSMFILALLALGFLPLLIGSLLLSADNATLATATQLVNAQMDLARQPVNPTCAVLLGFEAEVVPTAEDRQGATLSVTRDITCPAQYPGVSRFKAFVTADGGTVRLAEATTLVYTVSAG